MDRWAFGKELLRIRKGRGSRRMIGMLFRVSIHTVKAWEKDGTTPKHGEGMLRILDRVLTVGEDEEDINARGSFFPAWVRCADFLEGDSIDVKSCKVARIKVKRMMTEIEKEICGADEISAAPDVEDFAKGGSVKTDLDTMFDGVSEPDDA